MECAAYLAGSLEGCVVRSDGAVDWLRAGGARPSEEASRFAAFVASIDGIILGRRTFEVVRGRLTGMYGDKPVLVLSHRDLHPPAQHVPGVMRAHGDVGQVLKDCGARGWRSAYVDGPETIRQVWAAGHLAGLTINRIPVVLGGGIPLFAHVETDQWLEHVGTRVFAGGLVQSEYRVGRSAPPGGR